MGERQQGTPQNEAQTLVGDVLSAAMVPGGLITAQIARGGISRWGTIWDTTSAPHEKLTV